MVKKPKKGDLVVWEAGNDGKTWWEAGSDKIANVGLRVVTDHYHVFEFYELNWDEDKWIGDRGGPILTIKFI